MGTLADYWSFRTEEVVILAAVVLALGLFGSAMIYWLLRPKKKPPGDQDPFGDPN